MYVDIRDLNLRGNHRVLGESEALFGRMHICAKYACNLRDSEICSENLTALGSGEPLKNF